MGRRGIALRLSNPKAIIFFVALLPQFVDAKTPLGFQILILGVTSTVVEFVVLSGYSLAASSASSLVREPRYIRLTHRLGGALLICAGLGIALLSGD